MAGFVRSFGSITHQHKPYMLNVKHVVKPEFRDAYLEHMLNNQKGTTETENGALQFVVGEDVETPNTFYLHEAYDNYSEYLKHEDTAHFASTVLFFRENNPFTQEIVTRFVGSHSPVKHPKRSAYCLNVELCVKPNFRDEFLQVITNNAANSNKEPLCLQYVWGESTDTPNSFYFHEQYTGKEAGLEGFEAHSKTPHFVAWEEFTTKDPFSKPPVVEFFRTL